MECTHDKTMLRRLAAAVVVCAGSVRYARSAYQPAAPARGRRLRCGFVLAIFAAAVFTVRLASAQSDAVQAQALQTSYQALLTSFSAAGLPAPGTRVVVEQNEASVSSGTGSYMPDTTQPQFSGVTITDEAGGGAVSWHATTVASVFYGSSGYATGSPRSTFTRRTTGSPTSWELATRPGRPWPRQAI